MSGYILPSIVKRLVHTSSTMACQGQGQAGGKLVTSEAGKTVQSSTPPPSVSATLPDPTRYKKFAPTFLDKYFLVWSGHYKSRAEIPKTVDYEVIEKTRSMSRIRINLGFMVVGIATAVVFVYLGKQSFKQGDSLESRNIAWHKKIKEEYQQSQAQAASK